MTESNISFFFFCSLFFCPVSAGIGSSSNVLAVYKIDFDNLCVEM